MIISAIRTVLLYIIIIITVRLMGKRQISELQTSELVVTLLMSDIASIPMQNTDQSMLSGIIPILILLVCEIFISLLMLKHSGFRKLICGKPVIVINDGKVDQQAMKELRMSTEDLFEELRQKDIFKLEDVAFAIIETNGKMSVLKKPSSDTVTAKQLGVQTPDHGMQAVIISDGEIASSSLKFCGLDKKWLNGILKLEKLQLDDIFIMTADKSRKYNIIKKAGA
ncbi:MAG: DUF421 domain-containing protein [Clostridia bacterium]|nr:DUF421 domain-containing protein [Clostridia bacterium]MBR2177191.1 DUF421 domain-containing protein [Clostridia bacterium]